MSDTTKMFKEFVVYHFERVDRQISHEGWDIMCEPSDAGLQNVNLEWKLFLITVMQSYYSRRFKYAMGDNLPFIFEATVKIVVQFSGEELKDRIKLMSKEEFRNYVPEENIPPRLKYNPNESKDTNLIALIAPLLG